MTACAATGRARRVNRRQKRPRDVVQRLPADCDAGEIMPRARKLHVPGGGGPLSAMHVDHLVLCMDHLEL